MKLLDLLGKKRIFADGGMGTLLQARGLVAGELPELWNLSKPKIIEEIHESYLRAGANILTTNTFGANELKFPENLEEVVKAGVAIAKRAKEAAGRADTFVALDIGPCGKLLAPLGDLDFEDGVRIFSRTVRAGAEAGADLILIETMNDIYEAKAAVLAAKESCNLPVVVTCVFDEKGKMLTGCSPEGMVAVLEGLRVDALGVNCSLGPKEMIPIVKRIRDIATLPVAVSPNAGLPVVRGGETCYDVSPKEFADFMEEIAALGAAWLGGCCGTTPEYIREVTSRIKGDNLPEKETLGSTLCASGSMCLKVGSRPLIIGERINPTGKKGFKEALKNRDFNYIISQGIAQEDAGADILDVNVGIPGIDEADMITETVKRLQEVSNLPLQIDTSNPKAMERALRLYNGKAFINSVNGKLEVMDAIFPLAAKYGGVLVALCLDEDGIPETAEGRLAIAKKITDEAKKYGIEKKDLIFDPLTLTVSSDKNAAAVTLKALALIRDELKCHTVLGVSNVSFGLPAREILNSHFFTLAMEKGLSAGIINPNNNLMMQSFRSFLALKGMDDNFTGYIEAYSNYTPGEAGTAPAVGKKGEPEVKGLSACVERGLKEGAIYEANRMIESGSAPLDLIDNELMPALNRVGEGFEKGSLFLPQLLMAAEAAQGAFDVIKSAFKNEGTEPKGTVILATVKGDIHDIGKNIVKVLLENYGYRAVDLGKDVPAEEVLFALKENPGAAVGLSALMTTTVPNMEETIKLLKEEVPEVITMVGGAVLTEEYAKKIGADYYGKDAMATVRICEEIFG